MKRIQLIVAALTAAVAACGTASAAILFSDNFESDTSANYSVNLATGSHAAAFAFDYNTIGIPSSPRSGGTTSGLKVEANYAGGAGGGVSVSPLGLSLTGDFKISMEVWLNAPGSFPAGGSGSTQLTTYGWGTAGTSSQNVNARDSIVFGTTGEAGASQDWRVYPNDVMAASGSPIYAASGVVDPEGDDTRNHPHIYYSGFGQVAPPAAQAALFPQQTGDILVGGTAFEWHDVVIKKLGNTVTWTMDGLLIATVDASTVPALGGSNFFMGQSDINAGSSGDANVRSLLFGLFDNVVVEAIPEPASLTLVGFCLTSLCLMRKRK